MITFRLHFIVCYPKLSKKRCRITQHNLGEVIAQTEIVIIRMMCGSVCNTVVPSKEDRRAAISENALRVQLKSLTVN